MSLGEFTALLCGGSSGPSAAKSAAAPKSGHTSNSLSSSKLRPIHIFPSIFSQSPLIKMFLVTFSPFTSFCSHSKTVAADFFRGAECAGQRICASLNIYRKINFKTFPFNLICSKSGLHQPCQQSFSWIINQKVVEMPQLLSPSSASPIAPLIR